MPLRRRILDLILAADRPVTVAELTDELGCNHNAVRQHLARLRDAGLVAEVPEAGTSRADRACSTRPPHDPTRTPRLARLLLAARRTGLSPRAAGRQAGHAEIASAAVEATRRARCARGRRCATRVRAAAYWTRRTSRARARRVSVRGGRCGRSRHRVRTASRARRRARRGRRWRPRRNVRRERPLPGGLSGRGPEDHMNIAPARPASRDIATDNDVGAAAAK